MATSNAFSDYLENKVLDHVFGSTAMTQPTRYLALLTAAATDSTGGTEVIGAWYSRKAITFGAASGGTISNNNTLDFGTVSGSAVTITHWAILDAVTGGNVLTYGDFGGGQTASVGNNVSVQSGTVSISLN